MNAMHIEDQLLDYLDGLLDADRNEEIRNHLRTCEGCRTALLELQQLSEALAALPEDVPPADGRSGILEAIGREQSVGPRGRLRHVTSWLVRAAAVVVLMATSYLAGSHRASTEGRALMATLVANNTVLVRQSALSLIDHPSASKRLQAMTLVGSVPASDEALLSAVVSTMQRDPFVNVRLAALRALMAFEDSPNVRDALVVALDHETSPGMQLALIETLADLNEKRAVPRLRQLLDDDATPGFLKEQVAHELNTLS